MAWNIKAKLIESCSCRAICPCTLGPAEPDQGWCSGAFGIQVLQGTSDGVDLSGATLALHAELPGDFMGGMDKAKLYFDPSVGDDQRRELEAIFHGEKGGLFAGLREAIATWLPSAIASVTVTDGDSPKVSVEGVGEIVLQPLKTEDGKPTTLNNAPLAVGGFGQHQLDLAMAQGTRFSDPELREWESWGYGAVSEVEWAA